MGKAKTPQTTSRETDLAKAQAVILQDREAFAKEFFFPELVHDIKNNTIDKLSPKYQDMMMNQQRPELRQQNSQALRSLAQRGASGGIQATGLASLDVANRTAQGTARLQGEQLAQGVRAQTLGQIIQSVPSPTQAAPYVTETR